jgi:hypothetical protein
VSEIVRHSRGALVVHDCMANSGSAFWGRTFMNKALGKDGALFDRLSVF